MVGINPFAEENANRCRIEAGRNIFAVTKGKEWRGASGCALLSAGRDKETDFKGLFADGRIRTSILSPLSLFVSPGVAVLCAPVVAIRLMKLSISIRPFLVAEARSSKLDTEARPNHHLSQIIEHGVVLDLASLYTLNNKRDPPSWGIIAIVGPAVSDDNTNTFQSVHQKVSIF